MTDADFTVPVTDGSVLVASRESSNGDTLIYRTGVEKNDPISGTWIAANPLHAERSVYSVTLLNDGRLLVAGGYDGINVIDSVELY